MEKVFLGLGANMGDVLGTLKKAESLLREHPGMQDVRFSKYYETTPVSDIKQDNFINCACSFVTDLSPLELFAVTQEIEKKLGKTPKAKNMPRPIDIDILFFGTKMVQLGDLIIPHPLWKERLFVLVPLADLCQEVMLGDGTKIVIEEQIEKIVWSS